MYIQLKAVLTSSMLLVLLSLDAQVSRKYKTGETYRYRLTTYVSHNGKPHSTVIAECALQVVTDTAGIPFDEITWLSMITIKDRDTVAEQEAVKAVKPYRISLHPRGKVNMPPLTVAAMTGPITDFNTFFVAVSPELSTHFLVNKGETALKAHPLQGDFSNGSTILKGQDCLEVSVNLQEKFVSTVLFRTNFLPPTENCLSYLAEDMQTPVADSTINNFQMVQPAGPDRFNISYGNEKFIILSTVDRADGKILKAEMSNTLNLKTKQGCDASYKNCQGPYPFRIDRLLKLELLQ